MGKNLLNNYIELKKEDKESFLKILKEDLGFTNSNEDKYQKYKEITINGDIYFVIDYNKSKKEITFCMKDIMSKEDIKKYFTEKWYVDSDTDVIFNSDLRNNRYEDSYIYKVLNGSWKEEKLKGFNLIGDVRLLTKEEVTSLDPDYKKTDSNRYGFWTMTPYNDMNDLESGYARVFLVDNNGYLYNDYVSNTSGVRPVITLSADEL